MVNEHTLMQKQEKKKYNKKVVNKNKMLTNSKSFKYAKFKAFNNKNIFRIKKVIKYKVYKPLQEKFLMIRKVKDFSRQLSIKITSNNIFCNLKNVIKNTTIACCSSGKYKIKTTRKKLKHNVKLVLTSFFNEIKGKILSKNLIITIISPIKIRKQIIKFLSQSFNKYNLIIKAMDKKCFNGCRPPKKKRKKQKGLRIFK